MTQIQAVATISPAVRPPAPDPGRKVKVAIRLPCNQILSSSVLCQTSISVHSAKIANRPSTGFSHVKAT